jgi:hypothetical protein
MTATGAGGGAGGTFQGNGVGNGINATGGSGAGSGAGGAFTAGTSSNDSIVGLVGPIYPNCSAPTAPVTNRLYKDNVPKSYGTIVTNGTGGISSVNGFNVNPTVALSTASIQVTFETNMANSNYAVIPSLFEAGAGAVPVAVSSQNMTQFVLTTNTVNPETNSVTLTFIVMGQQ